MYNSKCFGLLLYIYWTYPNSYKDANILHSRIKALPSFLVNLVDLRRVELLTSSLQMKRSNQLNYRPKINGGRTKVRTWDLSLIRTAL